ncbi:MAG: diaminopimelate decarboxylase, partial [Deltaproteobacteria bacterium]|nr:diaminopimelate decarboxylase [Deltaproteobacteria bacterium]
DLIAVLDAGAYCYSMSSIYNLRERPAEVLIMDDGTHRLIRKRDTLEDMIKNSIV